MNQCWTIVNLTIGNNRNLYIVIQENAFDNVVWKMAAILSRPQCDKQSEWNTVNVWGCIFIDIYGLLFMRSLEGYFGAY